MPHLMADDTFQFLVRGLPYHPVRNAHRIETESHRIGTGVPVPVKVQFSVHTHF